MRILGNKIGSSIGILAVFHSIAQPVQAIARELIELFIPTMKWDHILIDSEYKSSKVHKQESLHTTAPDSSFDILFVY